MEPIVLIIIVMAAGFGVFWWADARRRRLADERALMARLLSNGAAPVSGAAPYVPTGLPAGSRPVMYEGRTYYREPNGGVFERNGSPVTNMVVAAALGGVAGYALHSLTHPAASGTIMGTDGSGSRDREIGEPSSYDNPMRSAPIVPASYRPGSGVIDEDTAPSNGNGGFVRDEEPVRSTYVRDEEPVRSTYVRDEEPVRSTYVRDEPSYDSGNYGGGGGGGSSDE